MTVISASSFALFLAASFSSLNPEQQREIDCLAVLTVAATEKDSEAKFGIPALSERTDRLSRAVGARYTTEYGLTVDDFTSIFTERLIDAMMRNTGGANRVELIRPEAMACAERLPPVAPAG